MTTTAVISLVVATSSEGEGHGYTGERNDIQSTVKYYYSSLPNNSVRDLLLLVLVPTAVLADTVTQ